MQVPIGVSGVQAVPKTLHSQGLMTPLSTSPHWHAFGSATRTPGTAYRSSASHGANSGRSLSALWEMNPRPRHSKWGRSSNTSASTCEGARVALVADDPGVLVLDLAATLADLGEQHGDGLEDVERLEAGGHERLAVLLGHEPVRVVADDGRHVTRARGSRRGGGRATRGSP